MTKRWNFYKTNLVKFIPKDKKILVASPNEFEIEMYLELGYLNITFGEFDISQLEIFKNKYSSNKRLNFKRVDLLNIDFNDLEFDYSITQATLHHLSKPHQGLLELFRVSRFGTLIIEGNDNFIMKLASNYNFSEEFEHSSVKNGKGGLMETGVPNYIYRWSENEVKKVICSFEPSKKHNLIFKYGLDVFNRALEKNKTKKIVKSFLSFFLKIIFFINKKTGNLFLIFIDKKNSKDRF